LSFQLGLLGFGFGQVKEFVGLEKKRTLHPWRSGGFDGHLRRGLLIVSVVGI